METVGYALLLILNHCQDTGAQCETRQLEPRTYTQEVDCIWEKRRQAAYYGEDNLVCARVARPTQWDRP